MQNAESVRAPSCNWLQLVPGHRSSRAFRYHADGPGSEALRLETHGYQALALDHLRFQPPLPTTATDHRGAVSYITITRRLAWRRARDAASSRR